MLRFRDIKNAQAAGNYYGKSDGGYYLNDAGLRREVGGTGAQLLGLESTPVFEEFERLLAGQHPKTGEQLTAKLVEHRIAGWDITASIPKGVTIALEQGDTRNMVPRSILPCWRLSPNKATRICNRSATSNSCRSVREPI